MPAMVRAVLAAAVVLTLVAPAAVSAAPPPGFVGMTADDQYWRAGPYRDKALAGQQAAGVQLLRVTFHWNLIEVSRNNFDFSNYDRYVLDAAKHNIKFLPVLLNPPDFRSRKPARGGTRYVYPPRDNADMARWALRLVDRYGRGGSLWRLNPRVKPRPITAWQIWNEPSLAQYWQPRPDALQYARMLRTVGAAIKRRDPKAQIVTAGLPASRLGNAIPLVPYLSALYRGVGRSAFDTVALNSYAVSPTHLGRLMDSTRRLMNRFGGRSDKLWITELGWCDKGYRPGHRFCVGSKRQARYIRDSISLIKRKRRAWNLSGFVLFSWRDGRPYTARDFWGNHTGLLTVAGKPKPAYRSFVRAVKRF